MVIGAVQFGVIWVLLTLMLFKWPLSLGGGEMIVRALPGMIAGVAIGYWFPRIPLFLSLFSFGDPWR